MILSTFLKRVLLIDAAGCLASAALLIPAAAPIAALTGLSPALVAGAGWVLVPFGGFFLWLGTRREAPAGLIWAAILLNLVWAVESLVVAAGGLTPLGAALVAAQALGVAGFAALEYLGLRYSRRVSA